MANTESQKNDFRGRIESVAQPILDTAETILGERPTVEHILLLLFLGTGVYMFWGAREFSSAVAEFPRVMSATTAVLAFLILARNRLRFVTPPLVFAIGLYWLYGGVTAFLETGSIQYRVVFGSVFFLAPIVARERLIEAVESFVATPKQVLGDEAVDDIPETAEDDTTEDEEMYSYDIDDPKGPAVTGALAVVYMLLAFTIGLLYASPIFIALWALWVRMNPLKAGALAVFSFVAACVFYDVITVDINEGWLTGWQPTPPDELFGVSVDLPIVVSEWLLGEMLLAVAEWVVVLV